MGSEKENNHKHLTVVITFVNVRSCEQQQQQQQQRVPPVY